MKNWLLAEFGLDDRAAPSVPRSCGSLENSAGRSGRSDPPVPAMRMLKSLAALPFSTSPVCAMDASITIGLSDGAAMEVTMPFRTLDQIDLSGKTVLVRVDINVPVEDGRVSDATRIERIVPTVRDVLAKGGRPVLLAHFDRPKGK